MGGTAQLRDEANRFTRLKPDPDAIPHPCERLAKTFTGEAATTAVIAPPTQKRMRNPRMVYAASDHLMARRVDLDVDFAGDDDHTFGAYGRLRSTASIMRDGAFRQHRAHKRSDVRIGVPSTLVPDHADDAFAVAVAGRIAGVPGELLWARWGGMDARRIAATVAWSRLIEQGEIDPGLHGCWARRAVLHGVSRSLYGPRYTRSYANAALAAHCRALEFVRVSKLAEAEINTALSALEAAFRNVRFSECGNDLPTELALYI